MKVSQIIYNSPYTATKNIKFKVHDIKICWWGSSRGDLNSVQNKADGKTIKYE